jgi:hypothetical protein
VAEVSFIVCQKTTSTHLHLLHQLLQRHLFQSSAHNNCGQELGIPQRHILTASCKGNGREEVSVWRDGWLTANRVQRDPFPGHFFDHLQRINAERAATREGVATRAKAVWWRVCYQHADLGRLLSPLFFLNRLLFFFNRLFIYCEVPNYSFELSVCPMKNIYFFFTLINIKLS